ncbi:CAP domain-containing protein [Marininema halotolerans]|nr:CAP-associated domain-containing protein [Marininema halotolerans]
MLFAWGVVPPTASANSLVSSDQLEFAFQGISIGDSATDVTSTLGEPQRTTVSRYGFEWRTYHNNYNDFVMVGIDDQDKVVGLYSNSTNWTSKSGIHVGSSQTEVREAFGTPLTYIFKSGTNYKIDDCTKCDVYQLENSYATVFYDQYQDYQVTSTLLIDYDVEQAFRWYDALNVPNLEESLRVQNFDLVNAVRVREGLTPYIWDDKIAGTAQDHSEDMATNNFYSHVNKNGEGVADRVKQDGISFKVVGENIAMLPRSAIYVHEGWMNSSGHRSNILGSYQYIGVGVAANRGGNLYWTQDFYTSP